MELVKRILYVTATEAEAVALRSNSSIESSGHDVYSYGNYEIFLLVAGIGTVATSWSMMKWFCEKGKPDIAVNGGIAGSFKHEIVPGEVVMPVSEVFADSGIEDNNRFLTIHEAGLAGPDDFPYKEGRLYADPVFTDQIRPDLRRVNGITSGIATGSALSRERLLKKYNPDIETMEGASFFYICLREKIPFMALRAISNFTGARQRNDWKIELALENLKGTLNDVILKMHN